MSGLTKVKVKPKGTLEEREGRLKKREAEAQPAKRFEEVLEGIAKVEKPASASSGNSKVPTPPRVPVQGAERPVLAASPAARPAPARVPSISRIEEVLDSEDNPLVKVLGLIGFDKATADQVFRKMNEAYLLLLDEKKRKERELAVISQAIETLDDFMKRLGIAKIAKGG